MDQTHEMQPTKTDGEQSHSEDATRHDDAPGNKVRGDAEESAALAAMASKETSDPP